MLAAQSYIPQRYTEFQWNKPDHRLLILFGGVLALLIAASIVGAILKKSATSESAQRTITNLNSRTRAWWKMSAIFALTLVIGKHGSLVLFALLSFLALR